jgi:5-methylcytosine-specific restriction endonuclease McrA
LTAGNHAWVLAAARHKTKREILEMIASLNPRPAAPTIITRLPPPSQSRESPPTLPSAEKRDALSPTIGALIPSPADRARDVTPASHERRSDVVTPLAPQLYKLQVTVTRGTHEKLLRAQALARHVLPNGDIASILDRALTLLLDHLERRRFARVLSPRLEAGGRATTGRYIPATVRRAVWQRDEGQCAFVGRRGRCRETAFLEFHHVCPYAIGGGPTTDNIELRCRAHNQYEARLVFGDMLVPDRQSATAPERDVALQSDERSTPVQ